MVETSLAGAGGRPAVLPRQPCEHLPAALLGKAVAGVSAFAFQVNQPTKPNRFHAGLIDPPGSTHHAPWSCISICLNWR